MKKIALILFGIILSLLLVECQSPIVRTIEDDIAFSESEECITDYGLEVFQVLDEHYALCNVLRPSISGRTSIHTDLVVLLYDSQSNNLYDHQEILLSKDMKAQKKGIYKYESRNGDLKTVPVVEIVNNK